jgi:general secretion pathway protein I
MNAGKAKPRARSRSGFTLIEVMVALALVAIGLVALLGLHHQDLQSVIWAQDTSRAAMLAQVIMTGTELTGFPQVGTTSGDFQSLYRGQYPNFRWRKVVEPSEVFPDIRKVTIGVSYGPGFRRRFDLVEYIHGSLPEDQQ